ncbi:MAG: YlxR family protein [Capsulimonadales bacterium]|nr:YlxR family protein [Capsulimonadales bacterium]
MNEGTTPTATAGRPRRVPQRTCVACRTTGGKRGLLRIVRLPDAGGMAPDPTGKRSGRGAYVCPTAECVNIALKRKALERSLKTPITEEVAGWLQSSVRENESGDV